MNKPETDFDKAQALRLKVKDFFLFDVCHKALTLNGLDESLTEEDVDIEHVSFYVSGDYVSLTINDCRKYIQYELVLSEHGVDLKALRKGNFRDMMFPDIEYLTGFIDRIFDANPDIRNILRKDDIASIDKKIDELTRQRAHLDSASN